MRAVDIKFTPELMVQSLVLPFGTKIMDARFDDGYIVLTLVNDVLPDIIDGAIPLGYVVYKQTESFFAKVQS